MSRGQALGIGALLVVAVHAWLVLIGLNPLHSGGGWDQLWDPDSFTRVLRVKELAAGAGWYDPTFRHANYPYGFPLHWSRLLDLLLLIPAGIASAVVPFDDALLAWSVALGPLLQVLALAALLWGTAPFLQARRFLLVAALFALQRGISYDFVPGQVDHHGLQVLFLVASLAALYREPFDRRAAWVAGAAGGMALWASAESVVIVLGIVLGLGFLWVIDEGGDGGRRILRYGVALFSTSVVALAVERGPAAFAELSYERLSLVQAALAASVAVAGAALSGLSGTWAAASRARRLAAGLGVAAGLVGALLFVFPALTRNPYGASAAVIQLQLLPNIAAEQAFLPTGPDAAYNFALEIGPGLLALAYCLVRLFRPTSSNPGERSRLVLSAATIVLFTAYAIYAYRGIPFVAAAAIVPWTEVIEQAWRYARRARGDASISLRLLRGAVPAFALGGFWLLAGVIAAWWMPRYVVSNASACRWDRLASYIHGAEPSAFQRAILTGVFDGPEVAYRTGRPVVGAPYHGNGDGIDATYRMLMAQGRDAVALLDARGVEFVALCVAMSPDMADVLNWSPFGLGSSLFRNAPPAGLAAVPLPDDVAGTFVLYRRVTGKTPAPGPSRDLNGRTGAGPPSPTRW